MNAQRARRGAVAVWLVALALYAAGVAWLVAWRQAFPGLAPYGYWREAAVNGLAFGLVGAVVTYRRPAHLIGWLFLGIGLSSVAQLLLGQYVVTSLALPPGALHAGDWAAWASVIIQGLTVSGLLALLFVFPTGHLPPGRWRLVVWSSLAGFGLTMAGIGLRPGRFDDFPLDNPLGLASLAPALNAANAPGAALLGLGLIAAVGLLLLRLRRATGIERQQLKWFVYAAAMAVSVLGGASAAFPQQTSGLVGNLLWTGCVASLAAATAVAILRYRLYDIDVIIRRTLVYALLTGALALVYVGSVISLGWLFGAVSGSAAQSPLRTVLSTLASAALFVPLRARVQTWIDRRFYRRKYDAAQTVRAFGARLRAETNLEALSDGLRAVVDETLQPAHASLWLRQGEESIRR